MRYRKSIAKHTGHLYHEIKGSIMNIIGRYSAGDEYNQYDVILCDDGHEYVRRDTSTNVIKINMNEVPF